MIYLHNTLTKKKELFEPISEGRVGMYHCGPTVYDKQHIGNMRSYVFADVLRRVFELNKYAVTQVINITDFGHLSSDADDGEDKMSKGLAREGLPFTMDAMYQLGSQYTAQFITDIEKMGVQKPDTLPRASDHIPEQIALIEQLYKKGYVYTTTDGLYFDTSKKDDYGKLSGAHIPENQTEARVAPNPEKHNSADFAVWKFSFPAGNAQKNAGMTRNDAEPLGWDSPWGKGFPGWHIECSAMNMKYLGEHFDIHTGGIDHIPIHHENEIAQSEAATGKPFVNYWLHHGHVLVGDAKMAKSAQNFITLDTLIEKGYSPLAYRYWLLTADYKKTVNFTWEALSGAEHALQGLYEHMHSLQTKRSMWDVLFHRKPNAGYVDRFLSLINDDINTPQVIALTWELVKDTSISAVEKYNTLRYFDSVLGLALASYIPEPVPKDVEALLQRREYARNQKDWDTADKLRDEIEDRGFTIYDTPDGPNARRAHSHGQK